MADLTYDEVMSDSDTLLWDIEGDPLLRSTVTSVWFLASTPDRSRMDAAVERTISRLPRLRQRVHVDALRLANPRWVDDPLFDVTFHYRWIRLPGRRPPRRVALDFAQTMSAQAFARDRPLWELTVVEGLPDRGAMLVVKAHHAITVGLGMVQMLQHMVDLEADPPAVGAAGAPATFAPRAVAAPTGAGPIPGVPMRSLHQRVAKEVRAGRRMARATTRTLRDLVIDPAATADSISALGRSVAKVLKPAFQPLSPSRTIIGALTKGVDMIASNVPGPPFPIWIAGSRIDELFAFGPLAGAAVNATLFSYDGAVHVGVNADGVAISDLALLRRCLTDGFADILAAPALS